MDNDENDVDNLLDIDYENDLTMVQRDLGGENLLEHGDENDDYEGDFSKSEQEILNEVIGSESPEVDDEDYDSDNIDDDSYNDYLANEDDYTSPIEDSDQKNDMDLLEIDDSVDKTESKEEFEVRDNPNPVNETEEIPEEPEIPMEKEPEVANETVVEQNITAEESDIPKEEVEEIHSHPEDDETVESDDSDDIYDDDGSADDSESDDEITHPINRDKYDADGNIIEERATIPHSVHDGVPKDTPREAARAMFFNHVDEIVKHNNPEVLIKYLKKFQSDDTYSRKINDLYAQEMALYSDYIDFENDPRAREALWISVSAKFAEYIERQKSTGEIKSSVEVIRRGNTGDQTIEDENLAAVNEYKKTESDKYSKYALERTIFEIADDNDDDTVSIFDERVSAQKEFYEGPFYPILKQVIENDDRGFCNMSNVKMHVTIGPQSSWIPVVDFSTGYRIVCINTDDVNQYRMNPGMIARSVKWNYGRHPFGEYRIRVLYSDNCKAQPAATIIALKKIVAFEYWDKKRVLTLNGKYALAYTTDPKYVNIFENGDLDAGDLGNSTYNRTKPHNCCVGVIAIDKKSLQDRRMARRNQVRNALNPYDVDININDYDIHFILSARYIRNDRTLTDVTRTPDQRYVQYTITQFTETKAIIPMDGFQTIVACIIKEHQNIYGPGVKYSIDVEIDRDNLPSPSIMDIIYSLDGVDHSNWRHTKQFDVQTTFCLPPSRAKMEGVFEFEKGRIDQRIFTPTTIQRLYDEALWRNYNLGTIDGRNEFIRSRGFEIFTSPAVDVYDIMPYALNTLATSSLYNDLIKVDMSTLGDRNSVDRENLLYQQQKLEYFKQLDKTGEGTLQKFVISAFDWLVDAFINE